MADITETAGKMEIDEKLKPIFKGEVLLCEDNEVNQHLIKSHITRLGLYIVIADNGKEGVDLVGGRMEKGQKPFDLILMDIQMPVMDGLTAADELAKLGSKTPIVALSANAADSDRRIYKEHGISDAVNKPFTTKELWTLLHKFFTPLGYENVGDDELLSEEEKRRKKLYTSFVIKNKTAHADISAALEAGDIKLAHRLAHTLRGLAGLMGKARLQEAARVVEFSLAEGSADSLTPAQMETLKRELELVLEELSPYVAVRAGEGAALDKERAADLFGRLMPLLEGDDASSQELTDDLRRVPETGLLVSQIEEYEFEQALETLKGLREKLGV